MNKIYDSLDIPSYPKTSEDGVAHFIHFDTPLVQEGCTSSDAYHLAKQQMSKASLVYTMYISGLLYNRFNSHGKQTGKGQRIFQYLGTKRKNTVSISHGISLTSVQELSTMSICIRMCCVYALYIIKSIFQKFMT